MSAPKILFPTDFSPSAQARLGEAVSLAKARRAMLLVLHVQEFKTSVDGRLRSGRLEPSIELVERMLNELAPSDPSVPVLYRFSIGDPATEIVRVAGEERVELIVMGGKRRGRFLRLPTGSVSESVVRWAKCPVIVYNPAKQTGRRKWIGAVRSNKIGGDSCGDDVRSFPSVCA
jgi:nucleotide-binding universal stress UspA family protein